MLFLSLLVILQGLRVAQAAVTERWPLLSPTFALLSFFLFRLLLMTHFGEFPMCEIIFHPISGHN